MLATTASCADEYPTSWSYFFSLSYWLSMFVSRCLTGARCLVFLLEFPVSFLSRCEWFEANWWHLRAAHSNPFASDEMPCLQVLAVSENSDNNALHEWYRSVASVSCCSVASVLQCCQKQVV